jgi:hypothetical protein
MVRDGGGVVVAAGGRQWAGHRRLGKKLRVRGGKGRGGVSYHHGRKMAGRKKRGGEIGGAYLLTIPLKHKSLSSIQVSINNHQTNEPHSRQQSNHQIGYAASSPNYKRQLVGN